MTDTLINDKGEGKLVEEPTGLNLPPKGFDVEDPGYQAPANDGSQVDVVVKPDSDSLQLIDSLLTVGWRKHYRRKLLIKAFGKVHTDHISWQVHG